MFSNIGVNDFRQYRICVILLWINFLLEFWGENHIYYQYRRKRRQKALVGR
jgi:hypothetical protein